MPQGAFGAILKFFDPSFAEHDLTAESDVEDTIQEFVLAIRDVKVSVFFDVNMQKCNPEEGCSLHSKWENCYSIPFLFFGTV